MITCSGKMLLLKEWLATASEHDRAAALDRYRNVPGFTDADRAEAHEQYMRGLPKNYVDFDDVEVDDD